MRTLTFVFVSSALIAACGQPADKAPEPKTEAASGEAEDAEKSKPVMVAKSANPDCLHEKDHDSGECAPVELPDAGTTGHFGSPFALSESKPLGEVLSSIGDDPVQVSGEVTAVCQKKGCWMVIKDGEAQARVLMKDHAFAIPFDGTGKKAVVEGTVKAKELSEGQVKHIEEDAGRDPSKVSGTRNEYILTASAVRLES
jgi:hypothetical protein